MKTKKLVNSNSSSSIFNGNNIHAIKVDNTQFKYIGYIVDGKK